MTPIKIGADDISIFFNNNYSDIYLGNESILGFDPSRLNNISLWLDASDQSTISTTGITLVQWNDKSGLDSNALPDVGYEPTYDNVNMSIDFSNQSLDIITDVREYFVVISDADGGSAIPSGSTECSLFNDGVSTTSDRGGVIKTTNTAYVWDGAISINNGTVYYGDGLIDVLDPVGFVPFPNDSNKVIVNIRHNNLLNTQVFGKLNRPSFQGEPRRGNMKIYEIISTSQQMSESDRANVYNYLNKKWQ